MIWHLPRLLASSPNLLFMPAVLPCIARRWGTSFAHNRTQGKQILKQVISKMERKLGAEHAVTVRYMDVLNQN